MGSQHKHSKGTLARDLWACLALLRHAEREWGGYRDFWGQSHRGALTSAFSLTQ